MKNALLLIVLFLFTISGQAQEVISIAAQNNLDHQKNGVKQPIAIRPVSGEIKLKHTLQAQIQLSEFLANDIKYPEALESYGLEGQIIVDVWVNTKGEIINTMIMKSFNNNFNTVVTNSLQNFELAWPQETSYLGARRLRVPIDFIME